VRRVRIPGKDELCTLDIDFEHIDLRQYLIFPEFANGDASSKKIILTVCRSRTRKHCSS
jgi:hypothetical protein